MRNTESGSTSHIFGGDTVAPYFLTLSRFALTAWVGAATIFVVTTVGEARSQELDSVTKAILATLRFPTYYCFAFTLLISAFVFGLLARQSVDVCQPFRKTWLSLIAIALILMTIDYFLIYNPLFQMTAAVRQARPAAFEAYHEASQWINSVSILLSFVGSLLIGWPSRPALFAER